MIRLVVFVVLMLFWLFFVPWDGDRRYIGLALVPWLCVAILGYEVYKAK